VVVVPDWGFLLRFLVGFETTSRGNKHESAARYKGNIVYAKYRHREGNKEGTANNFLGRKGRKRCLQRDNVWTLVQRTIEYLLS
jgi:hypothetical protein